MIWLRSLWPKFGVDFVGVGNMAPAIEEGALELIVDAAKRYVDKNVHVFSSSVGILWDFANSLGAGLAAGVVLSD